MIVSKHVKCPVNHEPQQLFLRGDAFALCVRAGDLSANIDVAYNWLFSSIAPEPEGNYVSGATMLEIPPIQPCDRSAADEGD